MLKIIFTGVFTRRQQTTQTLDSVMLVLAWSGLEYMHFRSPSGTPYADLLEPRESGCFLALLSPGTFLDFAFNAHRENWVLCLTLPELAWHPDDATLWLCGQRIPPVLRLSPERAAPLREEFRQLVADFQSGLPARQTAAQYQAEALLAPFLREPAIPLQAPVSPAALFKAAIDSDLHFRQTLVQLNSKATEFSFGHIRTLFTARYGLVPEEYRARLRLNRIFELFAKSDRSLKEISADVGMRNVTHLYAFLKARQNLTPKQLLQRYREL